MKTRQTPKALLGAILTILSVFVVALALAQDEDPVQRILRQEHERHAATGLMASPKLTPEQVKSILDNTSLKQTKLPYEQGPLVQWPLTEQGTTVFEVNRIITKGGVFATSAPKSNVYAFPEGVFLLADQVLPVRNPTDSELNQVKQLFWWEDANIQAVDLPKRSQPYTVYLVTKWKAVKVQQRMSWPAPDQARVTSVGLYGFAEPSADAVAKVRLLWEQSGKSPAEFLKAYPSVSRYSEQPNAAILQGGYVVGGCGPHAHAIVRALGADTPTMFLTYPAYWVSRVSAHAHTAVWDGSAWLNDAYPWTNSQNVPQFMLGSDSIMQEVGGKVTTSSSPSTTLVR